MSTLAWLENNVFFAIYNSANGEDPPPEYHIITRQQPPGGAPATFTFNKADGFIYNDSGRVPHYTVLRLSQYPPNLTDLLLVSSSAYDFISVLSRSKAPLASDKPADSITNVFTVTEMAEDPNRAQLPWSDQLDGPTFAVGTALDLSSKDKVDKPIPTEEMETSPGPLPGLWALNNEGVLSSWWVVYHESIRSGTTYPGMAAADTTTPAVQAASQVSNPFGSSASAATSAFSGASALGAKSSPWSTNASPATSTFGSSAFGSKPVMAAPTFGSSSFGAKPAAPAFGQSSSLGLGVKASPWVSATPGAAAATPAFGKSGFASVGATPGKVFGSGASTSPASSGFASFASKGGFGSVAPSNTTGGSIFQSQPAAPFGSKPGGLFGSPDVSMDTDTAFVPKESKAESASIGSTPFVLGTTFKADPKTANDNETPKPSSGGSLFGGNFGLTLNDAAKEPAPAVSKEEDMESEGPPEVEEKPKSLFSAESTTPTTSPAVSRFDTKPMTNPFGGTSLFGNRPPPSASMTSNIFGTPKPLSSEKPKPLSFSPAFATKVKREDEDKENLANIPEAPLPPDTTSKTVFLPGESSSSGSSYSSQAANKSPIKSEEDEAPLPPDFLQTKPKAQYELAKAVAEAAPLPPDFTSISSKSADQKSQVDSAEDLPLPPDFLSKKPSEQPSALPDVPGSPQGSEEFEDEEEEEEEEEEEQSEEDDDGEEGEEYDEEHEGEEGSELGSEGSGIDVANELSPTTTTDFGSQNVSFTEPQSSFTSEPPQPRKLFGEVSRNAPPLFPKPVPLSSPRSPSPMRSGMRPNALRSSDAPRSVSAPGVASQLLGRRPAQPQSNLAFSTTSQNAPLIDPNVEAQRKLAKKKKDEQRLLIDPEDEGIQQILQSEIEPTLHMHEFLAVDSKLEVQDPSGKEEIPKACETLWRDINRMIDRLGLNSRSLQSFILGHSNPGSQYSRSKEHLDNPDDWVLVEAKDLGKVVDPCLMQELEEGRIQDVEGTETAIHNLSRDLAKLRAKEEDMRKIIAAQVDPDQIAITRGLPLSAEQATQQNELRRAYTNFSKLLAETEEALTLLKAKIASAGGASGKAPVPTVEAILRTINKMTTMAERRSGDIDVLENQIRKLRLGSVGLNGSPGPNGSREGSPFVGATATPSKSSNLRSSIFSPAGGDSRFRESFASSVGSRMGGSGVGTPQRKKLSMFSGEEKKVVRQKAATRKAKLGLLKASLEKAGPNVQRMTDDD